MINANSGVDRDVDTDTEQMEDTHADDLNAANTQDRDGSFEASSGGSSYMSDDKSETIVTPQGAQDGN